MSEEHELDSFQDRRNDIGGKLSWLVISIMLAGFGGFAWYTANKGIDKADAAMVVVNINSNRITKLETQYEAINYRLEEIKTLIKYRINDPK